MSNRGSLLGVGVVKTPALGRGRIFHNLDSTKSLIFVPNRNPSDTSYLLARSQITFIKSKRSL